MSKPEWEPLHVSRVIDIRTTGRRGSSFEARVNKFLDRFGGWRLGRSGGRRALLQVVGPDYRGIVLWPRAKRAHH